MSESRPGGGTLVVISREGMGDAEPELRMKLLTTWLTLISESGMLPGAMAFYAGGVKLAVDGSPVLELLRDLESRGVHLILCKTCLDYHGIADRVAVGIVGGMPDIIAAQWAAEKVVSL